MVSDIKELMFCSVCKLNGEGAADALLDYIVKVSSTLVGAGVQQTILSSRGQGPKDDFV